MWVQTRLFFRCAAALYTFRNDKGETLVERGLEGHTPRRQRTITMLALYAAGPVHDLGPLDHARHGPLVFQGGWPKLPAHLANHLCDAPGIEGTCYGPCPGSPGFRMPVPYSLPGRSP